ncbi:MAG: alpha/beta hydrolase [Pseudoruegeria sp.]
MTQFFTTSDGLNLAYKDEGTGPPLICLAGLTRNMHDFDHIAPHLKDVRLIRMDYRGRGQSDYAKDYLTYSIPTEARDVVELMDHLDVPAAAILGTSRGGLIAMVLAATLKHRLTGVCFNDIGPDIASDGLETIMEYLGRRPIQKTYRAAAEARADTLLEFANVTPERWLTEVKNHFVETPDGLDLRYDPHLRDALLELRAQPVPDLWPLFDALANCPLALIRGANSNLLSEATAAEMRRRRPDMHFSDVPDRGHVPFLDEPQSLNVLTAFLKDIR